MADFVTLTCPSCGGKLQVTNDLERFACGYCGAEHIVRRAGGVVSLAPLVEGVQQVKAGVDRTASELAIKRLQQEISSLQTERSQSEKSWKESQFGTGCLASALLLAITVLFLASDYIFLKFIFVVITIIGGIYVYLSVRRTKNIEQVKWNQYDVLINKKMEELRYHQDTVSRPK